MCAHSDVSEVASLRRSRVTFSAIAATSTIEMGRMAPARAGRATATNMAKPYANVNAPTWRAVRSHEARRGVPPLDDAQLHGGD